MKAINILSSLSDRMIKNMQSGENKYDVIIIGSGMSSLTTASLLAQLWKKRVLVLERHFKPGGFTHIFGIGT